MPENVLRLASVFSDNMVFQRGVPAPVWGWAAAGAEVKVAFAGQNVSAQAGADGKWMATLAPLTAGGPHELAVESGGQSLTVTNVLVGEVWLCSGQSNMEWYVSRSLDAETELASADFPQIRLLRVPKVLSHEPQETFNATWKVCNRDNLLCFSGVAYFFGREIHKRVGVPVGLIDSSWGGTIIEAWTSIGSLRTQPEAVAILKTYAEAFKDLGKARQEYLERMAQWEKDCYWEDPGNEGEGKGWAAAEFDDSRWESMRTPGPWEALGMNIDGAVWFRRTIDLPAAMAGKELTLNLGAVDDYDTTYFNGAKVGQTGKEATNPWSVQRQYKVPASLAKAGRNVLAVRVFDRFGSGGLTGPAACMTLSDGANAIPLSGPWKFQVELALEPKPIRPTPQAVPGSEDPNQLAVLYNAMIHPLIPFPIAGATWYQGESNASKAYQYRRYFPLMIEDWRRLWKSEFMFLFVELANYTAPQERPVELQTWPELREAQLMALRMPKVGFGTAVDIGDAGDIHPINKQEVGRRLALWAMANQYGQKQVYSGPLYKSMSVEGGTIRVAFDHVGGGLVAGGKLQGFAIAGADRKWHWADAKIDGNTVVCSSAEVPAPAAVRYGWADNPIISLYNKEGLPASPFRTDNWPGMTEKN